MFNKMIKNALAIVPVALTAQAAAVHEITASYDVSEETLNYFHEQEGSFQLKFDEDVILEISYQAIEGGIYSTLSVDAEGKYLDVQTDTSCQGDYCKTTWYVQAGNHHAHSGFTIRTPYDETKTIPVFIVEDYNDYWDSMEEIVEQTTEDDSARRLQAEDEEPLVENCSMDEKEMLRFAAREDIPVEDLPWTLKYQQCNKLAAGADTEFDVTWAEAEQKSLQAKFLRAAGADIADVVCWKAGMDAGAPFSPGC